ncbi:MAG: Hsp20/alpha crystallin family protein [Gemmatimonadota bacterium]|nr:MAG: Hsp20/alpha crystallin family protein [Gemmatimonadota bacterium]
MRQLRGELDRVFNDVFGDSLSDRWAVGRGFGPEPSFPAVNVWEDSEKLYAEAEVPGLQMEDLEILVKGNELTVKGERRNGGQEGVTYHRRERAEGPFCSVVRLPLDVQVDGVEAQLDGGVLTITLPKAPSARPRKIEVKGLS